MVGVILTFKETVFPKWLNHSTLPPTTESVPVALHLHQHLVWSVFFNLFFNWSIIALQCCIRFCWTKVQISYKYTYVPHSWEDTYIQPPPSHPLGHHRALTWAPRALKRFPLAICSYMVVHICQSVSLSSSQPLLPPPPLSTILFSTSASLFLPCK